MLVKAIKEESSVVNVLLVHMEVLTVLDVSENLSAKSREFWEQSLTSILPTHIA